MKEEILYDDIVIINNRVSRLESYLLLLLNDEDLTEQGLEEAYKIEKEKEIDFNIIPNIVPNQKLLSLCSLMPLLERIKDMLEERTVSFNQIGQIIITEDKKYWSEFGVNNIKDFFSHSLVLYYLDAKIVGKNLLRKKTEKEPIKTIAQMNDEDLRNAFLLVSPERTSFCSDYQIDCVTLRSWLNGKILTNETIANKVRLWLTSL